MALSVGECDMSCWGPPAPVHLCEPEVEHLHASFGSDFYVGGLQVAVHDPFLVRRFDGIGDLTGDVECFVDREWASRDSVRERLAFDELEHNRADAA
jgi:hypothetical protein